MRRVATALVIALITALAAPAAASAECAGLAGQFLPIVRAIGTDRVGTCVTELVTFDVETEVAAGQVATVIVPPGGIAQAVQNGVLVKYPDDEDLDFFDAQGYQWH